MIQNFKYSILLTFIGLIIAYFLGGFYAVYITALLAILEVSLSFDNAIVNAKVLNTMDPIWQKRFITYGIPIAIFGMRLIFPIAVVSISSSIGLIDTLNIAMNEPEKYKSILESTEEIIFAFGGSFLLMVFLDFFFEEDREVKWIHALENSNLRSKFLEVNGIGLIISIFIGLVISYITQDLHITFAYFTGVLLHSIISSLDVLFISDSNSGTNEVIKSGILGFIYLEVLDASFSFDGVIGAFALSFNIFIIMIGLGIGAMFVRSLTIMFVEKKTLQEYKYLEHGAHYAILALSLIMLIKIFTPVNEAFVGMIGIVFIAISLFHSIQDNKKNNN